MTDRIRPLAMGALVACAILLAGPPAAALTFEEVLNLELAGVSETTILKLIDVERAVFHLNAYDIVRLKEAGASEDFIRELMDTPQRYGAGAAAKTSAAAQAAPGASVRADDYYALQPDDYATVFVYHYYDPFAYYWYPWPRYYVYYSPFWWARSGFYFAGHWCWDWWDPWGPPGRYCDWHYGYSRHFGPSRTRPAEARSWHRIRSAAPLRAEREGSVLRRAGLAAPANIRAEARVRAADQRSGEVYTTRAARAADIRGARTAHPARSVEAGAARAPGAPERPGYRGPGETRSRSAGSPAQRPTGDGTAVRSRGSDGGAPAGSAPPPSPGREVRRERPSRSTAPASPPPRAQSEAAPAENSPAALSGAGADDGARSAGGRTRRR
ncbi:MAG: hypothetical protein FJY75_02635 [Candidatus Eisenbacteria bacterium]|uniref:DUF3300 domain-containing protein n=1 Tax=Eiseniibacteriota bacterium TaxID=2212470 RepID=A0A938BQC4_UNCEI|nr:hypothetical protein [Candidatus Eisenbacteria bacterium]